LTLFFPYHLDFRGRAYASVAALTPQGDDLARALLRFAKGKPLGPRGRFWLAVHVANTYGYDKVSLIERVAWTEDHGPAIRDLARLVDGADALEVRHLEAIASSSSDVRAFWQRAKKPWQFLAACFEWARRDEPGFESRLPIALDASASGLQHLSALARDAEGAGATNLVLSDQIQDIYQRVADRVCAEVDAAIVRGDSHAAAWQGKINRDIVKPGVMTTPYAVTDHGRRKQVVQFIDKMPPLDRAAFGEGAWSSASYLARLIKEAVVTEVHSARGVMNWLQEVAGLLADFGRGVAWVSPSGFPVVVEQYRRPEAIRFKVPNPWGRDTELHLRANGDESLGIDREEQLSSIAPNVIHSLDAAHMVMAVSRLHHEGLRSFAVIHDSFGVHACDADHLLCVLKEEFAKIYERLLLDDFIDAQIARAEGNRRLVEKLSALKAERPAFGTLDVSAVLHAEYMFS
jgi:DNA-directed RNA polymerase